MYKRQVIEDDKALSDGIRLALQDAQHRIVQAETLHAGKCCLEKMIETSGRGEQERIDLVILDLNLPDGNGLELLQWIREDVYKRQARHRGNRSGSYRRA